MSDGSIRTDVLVVGGGLGGVAAALAAAELGRTVVLTEESPWLGGQLTSQAVPSDEHRWIEERGATRSYRRLREGIRDYYRRALPLAPGVDGPELNPGDGAVSPLCHLPHVALAVIDEMLAPHRVDGRLTVLLEHEPVAAETDGDHVRAVTLRRRDGDTAGHEVTVDARYVVDATEAGDLLALAGVEHVIGAESRADTGEPRALDGPAQPLDQQAFTWCFALDYHPEADLTIDRPASYGFWRDYTPEFWPGPLLSFEDVKPITLEPRTRPLFAADDTPRGGFHPDLWTFRRVASVRQHPAGRYASDVTIVNWPQVDYWLGPVVGVDPAVRDEHLRGARELSLSFLYWLQTEAPRHDGGTGYPGLRLRGDLLGGAEHGLALRPYLRESRRILAETTVVEEHVGVEARRELGLPAGAHQFGDSVGTGAYRIDLHPSTGGTAGPRTYVDIASYPFQIPLGALLPRRVENLLPGAKNIGTTHLTNGCYRLHPVEWNIGEAAGALAAHALNTGATPRAVRHDAGRLEDFQRLLTERLGIGLAWPAEDRTVDHFGKRRAAAAAVR